jgi:hypothetical protein
MRCLAVLLFGILAFVPAEAADNAGVFGVWRGKEGSLPVLTLNITDEGGMVAGAALFYFIRRDASKEPTASPGLPEPLLNPKIDGNTRDFSVSHRRAHPPRTLSDPPVHFRLKLVGPNRGELTRGEDEEKLELVKD